MALIQLSHILFGSLGAITKQIKRTRLRLVAYIQVLSRAAYLPNRYLFHLIAGQPLREKAAEQFFREKIAKQ